MKVYNTFAKFNKFNIRFRTLIIFTNKLKDKKDKLDGEFVEKASCLLSK